MERIDKIASYNSAFDFLTKFYNRPGKRPKLNEIDSTEIDLTADSDVVGDNARSNGEQVDGANNNGDIPGEHGEKDPIDLAAGLPGEGLALFAGNRVDAPAEEAVLALVEFPKQIVVALCIAVKYMKSELQSRAQTSHTDASAFGLENAFRHRSSFAKFINRAHMLLSSNTLINLSVSYELPVIRLILREIYRNQTDGSVYGSLLWCTSW